MALKQNAVDFQQEYLLAVQATQDCFYVNDGLVGADSANDVIRLREELQHLFSSGGFTLRKWRTSHTIVKEKIPAHLNDQEPTQLIMCMKVFTRVLDEEWNATTDAFSPLVLANQKPGRLTKRKLLSEVANLFDVLGWCSPTIIIPKMVLQRLWEEHFNREE